MCYQGSAIAGRCWCCSLLKTMSIPCAFATFARLFLTYHRRCWHQRCVSWKLMILSSEQPIRKCHLAWNMSLQSVGSRSSPCLTNLLTGHWRTWKPLSSTERNIHCKQEIRERQIWRSHGSKRRKKPAPSIFCTDDTGPTQIGFCLCYAARMSLEWHSCKNKKGLPFEQSPCFRAEPKPVKRPQSSLSLSLPSACEEGWYEAHRQ